MEYVRSGLRSDLPKKAVIGVTTVLVDVLRTDFGKRVVVGSSVVFVGYYGLKAFTDRSVYFLGKEEQLKVQLLTETIVLNGPGMKFLNPLSVKGTQTVQAVVLGVMDYVVVTDSTEGKERVERGPKLLYLGAYEEVGGVRQGLTLSGTEYTSVENKLTGEKVIVKGPVVWYPSVPYEETSGTKSALALQDDEYVKVKDGATGERFIRRGKGLLFLEPTWQLEGRSVLKAWTLKSYEYVRLQDKVTGKIRVERGENVVFPEANEELLDDKVLSAIDLAVDEYIKIEDQTSGEVRVETGVARIFLGANERAVDGGKKKAIQVDEERAVLVRDLGSGQVRLVTNKQLFVPGPYEAIEKEETLIRLADHEAIIIKDKDGNLGVHYGNPEKQTEERPRAFFLPPYAEVLPLMWSSGLRREKRNLKIERFDTRPGYMWFEFSCRTKDNVELLLETTLFWEVLDLEVMVRKTGNLPGDVYNQVRSLFIKQVATVTLKEFMGDLHSISDSIFKADRPFYDVRGVKIHSLEVTKYKCAEARTSEVLQQIIEETTNRLNRLSKAESENEVNIYRVQGQIKQEEQNGELQKLVQQNAQNEAKAGGAAEAGQVAAFMKGLTKDVPKLEDRISMWQTLRKEDALSVVSGGGGNLYYTPADVDLSIRTEGQAGSSTAAHKK